ncbi:mannan endo-1,4-beta-mannosidase-like [Artemia franciscana]|uniref:mannan endo-1,4-beta-mannosidase-like n=1 Tax=Artemia franciscana TaxID=6661 RepID=UPI0032D9BFDA
MNERVVIKSKKFFYKGQQVFFCGSWPFDNRGDYFGNDRFRHTRDELVEELDGIQSAGGNLVIIDVHKLAKITPVFDEHNYVVSTDKEKTLPSDLRKYLDEAKKRNIFVHVLLSTFAFKENRLTMNALYPDKVQSYIDNCLIPIVRELSGHPALLAYCVFGEPEFNMDIHEIREGPFKVDFLGLNWFTIHVADVKGVGVYRGHVQYPNEGYTLEVILRYINMLADAIHRTDPGALVSVLARSAATVNRNTEKHKNTKDIYSDELLLKAGGREKGYLDFLAIREKPWGPKDSPESYYLPINLKNNHADDFKYPKPIMFSYFMPLNLPPGEDPLSLLDFAYKNGYCGIAVLDVRDAEKKDRQVAESLIKKFTEGKVYDKKEGIIKVNIGG